MALRTGLSFAATTDCPERLAPGAAISGTTMQAPATFASLELPTRAEVRRGRNGRERVRLIVPELVAQRPDVERTMHHDDPAIQHALTVLGQAVNPIRVADAEEIREIYARTRGGAPPAGLNAFRAPGDMSDPNIYVNKNSLVYRRAAQKPSALTMLKLAATLAHEQVHNTDRDFAASRLQSDFVRSRMNSMPWRQQEEARRYLQGLDARASALARAEQLRHKWVDRLQVSARVEPDGVPSREHGMERGHPCEAPSFSPTESGLPRAR